jgi:DNA-binding MarR family transcriptional regulator
MSGEDAADAPVRGVVPGQRGGIPGGPGGGERSVADGQDEPSDPRYAMAVETLRYALAGLLAAQREARARPAQQAPHGELGRMYLLAALADERDLSSETLAAVVGLTLGGLREQLDRLGGEGLVEPVRASSDRRLVVPRLTPAGRRELDRLEQRFLARISLALGEFGPEELRLAARVLSQLGPVVAES